MDLSIITYFVPIRAVIGDNEPVTLEIKINANSAFCGYLEIITPLLLGFDKLCYQHLIRKKINIESQKDASFKFKIYHKDRIKEGIYPIKIKVYNQNIKKELVANLRVIKRKS